MFYGICHIAALPVRSSPSEKAEMINQLLFGEEFSVTEEENEWIKIRGGYDNFSGWVDVKGVMEITGKTFLAIKQNQDYCVSEKMMVVTRNDGTKMTILPGSSLPFFNPDSLIMNIEEKKYLLDDQPRTNFNGINPQTISQSARIFLNAPYQSGGRSLFGIDTTGFIQIVYKMNRIKLPRELTEQEKEGKPVSPGEFQTGDIAFFSDENRKMAHAGILMDSNRIIHASGRVRVDRIDENGIFNVETNTVTHHLQIIKRILPG